jgi:hypothetical protein
MSVQTFAEFLAENIPAIDRVEALIDERTPQKPIGGAELLDEFEWLIRGGVAPHVAADTLGIKLHSIHTSAARHGRADLRRLISLNDHFNTWDTSFEALGHRLSPARAMKPQHRATTPPKQNERVYGAHSERSGS